jgi:hypothetical protein
LTERFKNGMLSKRKKQICHLKKTTREIGGGKKRRVQNWGRPKKATREIWGAQKKQPEYSSKEFP